MFGVALDHAVDLDGSIGGRAKKIFGETADIFLGGIVLAPESAANLVGSLPAHVRLEQHLQNHLARFSARAHGRCQISVYNLYHRDRESQRNLTKKPL